MVASAATWGSGPVVKTALLIVCCNFVMSLDPSVISISPQVQYGAVVPIFENPSIFEDVNQFALFKHRHTASFIPNP